MDIPLAGVVLVIDALPEDADVFSTLQSATTCEWTPPNRIVNAMAGGPMLVMDGVVSIDKEREEFRETAPPVTFSQDETFDMNLLPRMGVGVTKDGRYLYCAAVDGRDLATPGMTLRLLGTFLRDLGCDTAMNLDGGSSKRMILEGAVIDNSTTEVKGGEEKKPEILDKEKVRILRTAITMELKESK